MTYTYSLVPLRIPTGWAVVFNNFWEIKPLIEEGKLVNTSDFTQDHLVIERVVPKGTNSPPYVLDLGWYPEEDLNGQYRLVLTNRNSNEVLKKFESSDYEKISEAIGQWLDKLNQAEFNGDYNQL